MRSLIVHSRNFIGQHVLASSLAAFVVLSIFVGVLFFRGKGNPQQFVTVTRGTIVETVSVTGNTVPVHSVSLGFANTGTVSRVYSDIGKYVVAGQILAELNTNDLYAQVRQAEASVATQQAKLEGLKAGSREEDLQTSRVSVEKARQDLANMYSGIVDISLDSYAKANDAVRTELDGFFSSPDSSNPKLTYQTSNPQAQTDAEAGRMISTAALNTWQAEVLSPTDSTDATDDFLKKELGYLSTVRQLLSNVSKTLDGAVGVTASTLTTYKASVAAAVTEVNTASKNLNTAAQNIASQKLAVNQLQAQLDLKLAGTSPEDIRAQEAQVASAVAGLQSARAKLTNSQLVSPISGVITRFDTKVGQLATPSMELVSIISGTNFEVEAGVPETDIGKLAVGNSVSMTIDAFPGELFSGRVFYINPAETVNQGVVDYTVKIAFGEPDPRMKSGLTANLDIATRKNEGVLILPQYAILQNDQGSFVQVQNGKSVKEVAVVLGLQDQKGNVEIKSGVEEGERVLSVGLK